VALDQKKSLRCTGAVALWSAGTHLPHTENALLDHTEAVRVAELRYRAGSMELLLSCNYKRDRSNLIKLRNTQLANRINLYLALESVDGPPPGSTTAIKL
jgi:hypothetical protein